MKSKMIGYLVILDNKAQKSEKLDVFSYCYIVSII